jgi:hypothetical protein
MKPRIPKTAPEAPLFSRKPVPPAAAVEGLLGVAVDESGRKVVTVEATPLEVVA